MVESEGQEANANPVQWTVNLDSWTLLRLFAYAKLVGVYGFLVFVVSNVPLLLLSPSGGRLVSDSSQYVGLSNTVSAILLAVASAIYVLGGKELLGRVVSIMGTDEQTVFDYIGVFLTFTLIFIGAVLTAIFVAYVSRSLVGVAVVIVPVFLKITDTVVSLVVPLSGAVDLSTKSYHVGETGRSYDLASAVVLGTIETGGVTVFCIRSEDGLPHVLTLPTTLYERLSKA